MQLVKGQHTEQPGTPSLYSTHLQGTRMARPGLRAIGLLPSHPHALWHGNRGRPRCGQTALQGTHPTQPRGWLLGARLPSKGIR